MFVSSKTFMELVERQVRMEAEMGLRIKQLEERVETLEKRPIMAESSKGAQDSSDTIEKLYHEMMDGVKDEKAGRVIYTDGRD